MQKKVNKSFDDPYGCRKINTISLDKPILLGVFPENLNVNSLNGYLNKMLYLLQIRHQGTVNSDCDVKDLPFDILVRERDDDIAQNILSLIGENNIVKAKEIMRKVNIISYCAGNADVAKILKIIYNGLLEKNYTKEDAKEIMQEIFVLEIVDNYRNDKREIDTFPFVKSVIIHNIHDGENFSYIDKDFREGEVFRFEKKNDKILVLYKSFGEGSLSKAPGEEHEFTRDYINAPVINMVMSMILINVLSLSIDGKTRDYANILQNIVILLKNVYSHLKESIKNIDDYTKNDLNELNEYVMKLVHDYFIQRIKITKLTANEKERLDTRDKIISEYSKANLYRLHYQYDIDKIKKQIERICYIYYEYPNDTIEINLGGNAPLMVTYTKIDYVKTLIGELQNMIDGLINELDSLIIPNDITTELKIEQKENIQNKITNIKNIVMDEKLIKIMNEIKEEISINVK